jgi:hypothetical protein
MAKFGKYRSFNKVEQAYYGVDTIKTLKYIKEDLQMLRKNFKKPIDERLDDYSFDRYLKDSIGALNRIFEQIKRDQEKDKGLN